MTDANIIPFRKKAQKDPLAYDPGVVPFNPRNPDHVAAWNLLFKLAALEPGSGKLRSKKRR